MWQIFQREYMVMKVVTRFAPSPTGYLHIGGARTALFNWLFAKRHGGQFLLRIEDTDRERSTDEAVNAIIQGLQWLELDWDGKEIYQFTRAHRHVQVARKLLQTNKAYYCYCTKEELEAMRYKAIQEKRPMRYDGRWRHKDPKTAPEGIKPVIRLKAPLQGILNIDDAVQGEVKVKNSQLDDMVLVRSDGTPTYMLAVVVDDYDMGVTHVIRGDDHLNNAFRQKMLYEALGWDSPCYAHIPLIHGSDGAKLSKRHGALGVGYYQEMGYLPEAMRNYLLRLGWAHGDDEIINMAQATEWFDLANVGKSPARFDIKKLDNLNKHYLNNKDHASLVAAVIDYYHEQKIVCTSVHQKRLLQGMDGLKKRATTINQLAESAFFYIQPPLSFTPKAKRYLQEYKPVLMKVISELSSLTTWNAKILQDFFHDFGHRNHYSLGQVMTTIRAAVTGMDVSPGMFEVMEILGQKEVIIRIQNVLSRED